MRLGPIILAVIVVAELGAAGYHYVFRGFVAAQTSLAQISDDDWRRGADVMSALEGEVSPSAMMLAARVGNRRAQTLAGDALANGSFGYPFDPDKGASLLARAAEAGDVRAQIALSIVRPRRTLDREPDLDEARRLMRAAAAQDAPLSLYAGAALALGFDPEGADFAEGERLLAEARRLRVPAALALIARTNWQSGAWASSEARYAALQEAVEAGSANAASILGRAYLYGGFGSVCKSTLSNRKVY